MEDAIIMAMFLAIIGWLWLIVDCIAYESEDKTVWLSILLVANIAGALGYLALRYRSNRKDAVVRETMESITQS